MDAGLGDRQCATSSRFFPVPPTQVLSPKAKARYLEMDGWLVQDGDLFVKFTNPANGPRP